MIITTHITVTWDEKTFMKVMDRAVAEKRFVCTKSDHYGKHYIKTISIKEGVKTDDTDTNTRNNSYD